MTVLFRMAKSDEFIRYKYALAFFKLLMENKKKGEENKQKGKEDLLLAETIGDISSSSELRKATISYILSGLSNPKATTVDALLDALRKSYLDFANYIDNFSDTEVWEYKKMKEKERAERNRKRFKKKTRKT
jgi:transcriptional regulator with XRE-family HTH domain